MYGSFSFPSHFSRHNKRKVNNGRADKRKVNNHKKRRREMVPAALLSYSIPFFSPLFLEGILIFSLPKASAECFDSKVIPIAYIIIIHVCSTLIC